MTLPALAQDDAPAPNASPDDIVEQYASDRGLTLVLAAQLRDRLNTARDPEKPAIADRLGSLYVEMLDNAKTPGERASVEAMSRALLSQVPEADSFELRIGLAKARYLFAEEIAERHRLRLASLEERAEAERILRDLAGSLQSIGARVHRQVETLESREKTGQDPDPELLQRRLAEARRLRSLAMYYAAWSGYYLSLLTGSSDQALDALKAFGWLLNSSGGRPASVDRAGEGMLRYEHVARAAMGAALCESQRGNDEAALRWLDLLDRAPELSPAVKGQLFARRIVVYGAAGRWADLDFFLSRRKRESGKVEPLPAGEARLLAIFALEALARPATRERVRPAIETLARAAMGDLVARGEVAQVLDLVERFGSAHIGTTGFIVNYVRGLQLYERSRKAQQAAGEDPEEPTRIDRIATDYRAAATALEASLAEPDAAAFAAERANAQIVGGLCLFRAGDFEAAARRFEQAHRAAANAQQADEALWLAVVALDRAVEGGRRALAADRDRTAALYLQSYPAGERAAKLLLREGTAGLVGDERAVEVLLSVRSGSPLYPGARRQAARLLYRMYKVAPAERRDFAGVRFLGVAEELLGADRQAAAGAGPEAKAAAESAAVTARQVLDVALGLSVPDVARAAAALDALDGLALRTGLDLENFAGELAYRRLQVALARGDDTAADRWFTTLQEMGGQYATAADRLIYRRLLDAWNRDPTDVEASRRLVDLGRRLTGQYRGGPEALRDPAVATLFDAVARAAVVVWRHEGGDDLRDLALDRSRRLLAAGHRTADTLRRIAELAEPAGDPAESLEAWRVLMAALTPGTPEWYEARYHSLRLLLDVDPERAAEAMRQHRTLYPEYGPEPWGARLRELDAKISGAGGAP